MSVPADMTKPRPGLCFACGHDWPSTRKPGDPFEACPNCGSDKVVVRPHPPSAPSLPMPTFYEPAPERKRWRVTFAWYDLWLGAFYSRKGRVWYFCPLPTLLVTWDRQQPKRKARRG